MKKFLALIMLVMSSVVHGDSQEFEGYSMTVLLPVDWTAGKRQNLVVTIPKGYRSIQPPSEWTKAPVVEFIPQGEGDHAWSEIITTQRLAGARASADKVVQVIRQNMAATATNIHVVMSTASKRSYQMAFYILKYRHQGREEMMGMQYFSGPHDCSGVQYTIRLGDQMSEHEATAKICEFFEHSLQLTGE